MLRRGEVLPANSILNGFSSGDFESIPEFIVGSVELGFFISDDTGGVSRSWVLRIVGDGMERCWLEAVIHRSNASTAAECITQPIHGKPR